MPPRSVGIGRNSDLVEVVDLELRKANAQLREERRLPGAARAEDQEEHRASSAAFVRGQSSSITAYHAESRRCPPRTSMCLRKTPSNSANDASAARERALSASVLNSTRRKHSSSNACCNRSSFASVFAPVPHAAGTIHVFPISATRSSSRTFRKLV